MFPAAREVMGVIADNLKKAVWGCVSTVDSNGRTIWIADAHRGNGKRFVAHANEKLTAFVQRESICSSIAGLSGGAGLNCPDLLTVISAL